MMWSIVGHLFCVLCLFLIFKCFTHKCSCVKSEIKRLREEIKDCCGQKQNNNN